MKTKTKWNIPRSISTMPESLEALAEIIKWGKENQSPLGYFAALYTKVGLRIESALQAGKFQHPEKLRHLDIVFFNRYLEALYLWHEGKTPSLPWQVACDATSNSNLIALQHLLMAMNAHIDLDLGVATAEAIPKDELKDFETDFGTMNQLLASIMHDVENDMALIFRMLRPINWLFRREEDLILNFSMKLVRSQAWDTCIRLSKLDGEARDLAIHSLATKVGNVSQAIADPGRLGDCLVAWIRRRETGDVATRIWDLQQ